MAAGANVNAAAKNRVTPLYAALSQGHQGVANLLLAAGAKRKGLWDRTPDELLSTFLAPVNGARVLTFCAGLGSVLGGAYAMECWPKGENLGVPIGCGFFMGLAVGLGVVLILRIIHAFKK